MAALRQRRHIRSFATRATPAMQYQIIWKFGSAATCLFLERNCTVGPPRPDTMPTKLEIRPKWDFYALCVRAIEEKTCARHIRTKRHKSAALPKILFTYLLFLRRSLIPFRWPLPRTITPRTEISAMFLRAENFPTPPGEQFPLKRAWTFDRVRCLGKFVVGSCQLRLDSELYALTRDGSRFSRARTDMAPTRICSRISALTASFQFR
jgi:hypothetical protein